MKTTINLGGNKRLTTSPLKNGDVLIEIQARDAYFEVWETRLPLVLTEDQAGVLIFGMEQAFDSITRETIRKAAACSGVRCHGDACAAGQLPCPSPTACGVEA